MVSKEALDEFKKIWAEEFGENISDENALDQATNLLVLFNAIYNPIKKDWVSR